MCVKVRLRHKVLQLYLGTRKTRTPLMKTVNLNCKSFFTELKIN